MKANKQFLLLLGMRSNRTPKLGTNVCITPFWGHELGKIIFGFMPRWAVESIMRNVMVGMKAKWDGEKKKE